MSLRAASISLLLGLILLPMPGTAADGEKLQLYVMPDTQSWAWNQGGNSLAIWHSVAQALCKQRHRFTMVLHTGDLVDTPRLRPFEWTNALSAMKQLDACGMPYAIAFGNHDFDNYPAPGGEAELRGDRSWTRHMAMLASRPAESAPSRRSGIYPMAPGWFVVTADLHASPDDLAWIAAEIGERPSARFVLLHHYCVKADGIAFEWCRQLLERHPEIRIAVSGHWLGRAREGWKEVARANGRKLVALYQNYQHVPDLAAWGVVVELEPASGALCVWSEDLLSGAVRHPAAYSAEVGAVAPGVPKRCFAGSGATPP